MEKIEVHARFDSSGKAIPTKFFWQGQHYFIESIGRRWKDSQGVHILVQTGAQQVYELLYHGEIEEWWLVKRPRLDLSA